LFHARKFNLGFLVKVTLKLEIVINIEHMWVTTIDGTVGIEVQMQISQGVYRVNKTVTPLCFAV